MSDILTLAHQACREHRVLRITHFSPAEKSTERDIEVYWVNDRYLDTICRLKQDFRTFRIDRIRGVELLPETFEWNQEFAVLLKYLGYAASSNLRASLPGSRGLQPP